MDLTYQIDYGQLYAQILHLYKSGERYYFSKEEKGRIEAHNSMFEHKSKEYEMLCTYFRHPRTMMDEKMEYLTASEILDHISRNSPKFMIEHSTKMKIGQALIKQKYKSKVCHAGRKYAVCRLNNTAVSYIQKHHPQSVYDKEYDYYIPLEVIKATEGASVSQILMVRDQLKGEEKTQ